MLVLTGELAVGYLNTQGFKFRDIDRTKRCLFGNCLFYSYKSCSLNIIAVIVEVSCWQPHVQLWLLSLNF